jgi:hypothetical protein
VELELPSVREVLCGARALTFVVADSRERAHAVYDIK